MSSRLFPKFTIMYLGNKSHGDKTSWKPPTLPLARAASVKITTDLIFHLLNVAKEFHRYD